MEPTIEWRGAVAHALAQFRLSEAATLARLAVDYPIAFEYAEMLDGYDHFMMQSHPASGIMEAVVPFSLAVDGFEAVVRERDRLQTSWSEGWTSRPVQNLYVFAYWATCQADGRRATMWLRGLFEHLQDERSKEVAHILGLQERAYLFGDPLKHSIDLYVALEMARTAIGKDSSHPSPDILMPRYVPMDLLADLNG